MLSANVEAIDSSDSINDDIYEWIIDNTLVPKALDKPALIEPRPNSSGSNSILAPSTSKSFRCLKCSEIFAKKSSLKNHIKSVHVDIFNLKSSDGTLLTSFVRNPETKCFHCRCGGQFKSICKCYDHRKCLENNSAENSSEAEPVTEHILERLGLKEFSKLLICVTCESALSKASIKSHFRQIHKTNLTKLEISYLEGLASNMDKSLYYPFRSGMLIPMLVIPFLPVLEGVTCIYCALAFDRPSSLNYIHQQIRTNCSGLPSEFVKSKYQRLRFGQRKVGFAICETLPVVDSDSLRAAELLLEKIRNAVPFGPAEEINSFSFLKWLTKSEI